MSVTQFVVAEKCLWPCTPSVGLHTSPPTSHRHAGTSVDAAADYLSKFDSHNDGYLELDDFRRMFARLLHVDSYLPSDVDVLLHIMDTDGNGSLDYAEVLDYFEFNGLELRAKEMTILETAKKKEAILKQRALEKDAELQEIWNTKLHLLDEIQEIKEKAETETVKENARLWALSLPRLEASLRELEGEEGKVLEKYAQMTEVVLSPEEQRVLRGDERRNRQGQRKQSNSRNTRRPVKVD